MTARLHSADIESPDSELRTRFHSDVIPQREPLYHYAMRMTRNHADAEDLLQETMLKAYAGLHSFMPETNLRAWLFRIMTNGYINTYRKEQRRPAHYVGHITDALLATAAHRWSMGPRSAEEETLNKLGNSDIQEAMRALPAPFRIAVYYADVEGFSCKEIADLMQTPVGTVKSRVHRGRRLLRHLLVDVADQRGSSTVEVAA